NCPVSCRSISLTARLGSEVLLPCSLWKSNKTEEARWSQSSTLLSIRPHGNITFEDPKDGRMTVFPLLFSRGNFSILVHQFQTSDMGIYCCQLTHECQRVVIENSEEHEGEQENKGPIEIVKVDECDGEYEDIESELHEADYENSPGAEHDGQYEDTMSDQQDEDYVNTDRRNYYNQHNDTDNENSAVHHVKMQANQSEINKSGRRRKRTKDKGTLTLLKSFICIIQCGYILEYDRQKVRVIFVGLESS
ncbi:hypothetical protein C0J50_19615, partial [Silurus asotus]